MNISTKNLVSITEATEDFLLPDWRTKADQS